MDVVACDSLRLSVKNYTEQGLETEDVLVPQVTDRNKISFLN